MSDKAGAPTVDRADDPTSPARGMFIEGGWTSSASGEQVAVRNPATGAVIATVPRGSSADVDAAVRAARAALEGDWGRVPPAGRGRMLARLAELVSDHADELSRIESDNVGKPIREALALDVPGAASVLEYYAGWANKVEGTTVPHSMLPVLNYTVREPVGVVAAIVPWNFPLAIAVWKLAPALAMGNSVVLKPAELTPLSMLRLCELAEEAGLPGGALNVVTGSGREVGEALVSHPGVDKVAFTGSTETGRRIMGLAAPTLKKLTLECGGKSPNLVFADADLERAVEATLFGVFANQGEVCAAGSRLLVQSSIHEELLRRLVERGRTLRVGDPSKLETDVGPLVSPSHYEQVTSLVEAGVRGGARVVLGGDRARVDGLDGDFLEPTIFDGVDNGMPIAREEIFGPVLSTIVFEDEADAVQIANDTMYGLVANLHTQDVRRAHAVAGALQCGTVFVNLPPIPFAEAPIGGYKQTGIGKDLGREALDAYLVTKSVIVDLAPEGRGFRWYEPSS